MSNATHNDGSRKSSERVNLERATCISQRPAWAAETLIGVNGITYNYTSGIVAQSIEPDGSEVAAVVELQQDEDLHAFEGGVILSPGGPRIFLLDTWLDVDNARLLAKALLDCCNRFEDATYETATEGEL